MDENALPNEVIIHTAQLLSYLRMGKLKLGLLIDFNVAQLRNGIKRVVNQL